MKFLKVQPYRYKNNEYILFDEYWFIPETNIYTIEVVRSGEYEYDKVAPGSWRLIYKLDSSNDVSEIIKDLKFFELENFK